MKCPQNLSGEGRKFFLRHKQECCEQGTLTESTLDSYILLCRTWGMLSSLDPDADERLGVMKWVALTKTFERQGLQFAIAAKRPPEKKQTNLADVLKDVMDDDAEQTEES